MGMYRKKPVVIEAIQYDNNLDELTSFVSEHTIIDNCLYIITLEGDMKVSNGDFIIKGVEGEFYPCKPAIFHKTYEEVV